MDGLGRLWGGSWARSVFRHGVGPLAACHQVGRGLVGSTAWVCWETLLGYVGCGEAGGRLRRPVVVGGGRWLSLLVGGWLVGWDASGSGPSELVVGGVTGLRTGG